MAQAGILTASATGDATIGGTPDGGAVVVDFVSFGGLFAGTPFLKSVTGFAGSTLTFTYDQRAFDFDPADRLVLDVTNNTGTTIKSMTYTLENGAKIFDYFGGTFAYPGIYSSSGPSITTPFSARILGTTSFTYNAPVADGSSIAFYIPIDLSGVTTPGTFTLIESDTIATPEPGSLTVFGLGLAIFGGLSWRRKRSG